MNHNVELKQPIMLRSKEKNLRPSPSREDNDGSKEALMTQFKTLLVAAVFALPALAKAQGSSGGSGGSSSAGFGNLGQRAEKRESSRWTLQEWLAQKDRNRMMDMWLSMNSPSPFEAMVGGSYLATSTRVDAPATEDHFYSYSGELAAYAQFVGVGAEYGNNVQENYNDLAGMLNLRLLGNSLQNSSLTVQLGQRTRTFSTAGAPNAQRNVFSQVTLQLYVAKYFGIDGHYRFYEPSANAALNETIGGTQSEAGVFIDFKAIRVFGSWYRDVESHSGGALEQTVERSGIKSGFKIFY